MGNFYASTPWVKKALGIIKVIFSCIFQQQCKSYPPHFQFQFNSVTFENVQIPSSKSYINSDACRSAEATFEVKITTSEKLKFHI